MRFLIRNEIPIRKKLLGTCAIGIDLLVLRIHAAKIFKFSFSYVFRPLQFDSVPTGSGIFLIILRYSAIFGIAKNRCRECQGFRNPDII